MNLSHDLLPGNSRVKPQQRTLNDGFYKTVGGMP